MKETELQKKITKWLRSDLGVEWIIYNGGGCSYDTKVAHGGKLYFSKIPEHQRDSLMKAGGTYQDKKGRFLPLTHKISDSALGFKPMDGFAMFGAYGCLLVGFVEGGGRKLEVFDIDINDWVKFVEGKGGRGSLNYEEAMELGRVIKGV